MGGWMDDIILQGMHTGHAFASPPSFTLVYIYMYVLYVYI